MSNTSPDLLQDARRRIEASLEDSLDRETLDSLLEEVLAIRKQARGWCPNCKKAVMVEIPDAKAVSSAMGDLLTQAKGRPGEQRDGGDVSVSYVVLLENPDGSRTPVPPSSGAATATGATG